MAQNYVFDHMMKNKVPLTRENYLNLAYFGDPPDELSAEQEAELPEMFQSDAGEDFERRVWNQFWTKSGASSRVTLSG